MPTPSSQASTPQASPEIQEQRCSIAGQVLGGNTAEPVRSARVVLTLAESPSTTVAMVVSDKGGRFSIDNLRPGRYSLHVERHGFAKQAYGQKSADHAGAVLTLRAGQNMRDLLFRLQPAAVISGRVTDENGEPLPWAHVMTFKVVSSQGKSEVQQGANFSTNDLGEYRIFDLTPGRYFIRASLDPRPLFNPDNPHANFMDGSVEQLEGAYAPVYYPGVFARDTASAVNVKSGDEIPGIDMVLTRIQTVKVRGRAIVAAVGAVADGTWVSLRTREHVSGDDTIRLVAADSATGEFQLMGVIPGAYMLYASGPHSDHGESYTALQPLDVGDSDVENVALTLRLGIAIPGEIRFEGAESAKMSKVEAILVRQNVWDESYGATAKKDGSLTFTGIHDGSYSVEVRSDCNRCYLKSATARGIDLLTADLHLDTSSPTPTIQFVYSTDSGTLDGTVQDADELPAVGAVVELIPDSLSRKIQQRFKRTTTNQYGRFQIEGIAPGIYTVFSWETPEEANTGELEFIMSGETSGEEVELNGNEKKTVRLMLTRNGQQ